MPLVVEDECAPILVLGLARIGIFVKGRTIEGREAVCVSWKMRGHPVEDHADAVRVTLVDEITQVVGRAVSARGGEMSGGLIAPRVVEWMLRDGEQLNVREPEAL